MALADAALSRQNQIVPPTDELAAQIVRRDSLRCRREDLRSFHRHQAPRRVIRADSRRSDAAEPPRVPTATAKSDTGTRRSTGPTALSVGLEPPEFAPPTRRR